MIKETVSGTWVHSFYDQILLYTTLEVYCVYKLMNRILHGESFSNIHMTTYEWFDSVTV